MATCMEHPTKRYYDSDSGDEAPASKKAQTIVMMMEEESSDDEIMSESVGEEEKTRSRSDDDDFVPDCLTVKTDDDIVREFQIFLQVKCHYDRDRANMISSEKDAHKFFHNEFESFRDLYWRKWWHIRPNPDGFILNDYQRLAIYPSWTHRYYSYAHYYFTYDFDSTYHKFVDELSANIQWDTNMTEAWSIAEKILKKHMPADVLEELPDYDALLGLVDDSISRAMAHSGAEQSAKELTSLFADLYKREVDGEDFVQALKEIIQEKRLESYPYNKSYIEEALNYRDGLLWCKYCSIKRNCDIQEREAIEENMLKGLITRHFESTLQGTSQDVYTEYVEKKISIAKELGIL